MKIFLIHRSVARKAAVSFIKSIASKGDLVLDSIVLDSFGDETWKSAALSGINECEAVVVYDLAACKKSKNAAWEMGQAREMNKPVIQLDPHKLDVAEIEKLHGVYHYNEEFNSYFKEGGKDTETLYKTMVDSSEQLIERRQRLNAFFITTIGSLLAIAGALVKFGAAKSPTVTFLVMGGFGITGLLLCNSWSNLIDNYGKLNAAKFRVILKLEQSLSAQIFAAEWTALGKGRRPKKYKSFTSSENSVPLWFAILIFSLVLISALWKIWG